MYSAEDFAAVQAARGAAGRDGNGDHHWVGGYIGDGETGAANSCSTTGNMWAYWKEKDTNAQTFEYIIRDGDEVNDGPHSKQGFTSWYSDPPFTEIATYQTCGCPQDPTGYALRLHDVAGNWRWRCNDQPGYAMCQAGPPAPTFTAGWYWNNPGGWPSPHVYHHTAKLCSGYCKYLGGTCNPGDWGTITSLADAQAKAAEAFANGAAWDGTLITTDAGCAPGDCSVGSHGHGTDNGDGTRTYNVESDVTPPGLDRNDIAGADTGIQSIQGPGFCADDPGLNPLYSRNRFFYSTLGQNANTVCSTVMNCSPLAGYRLCYCSTGTSQVG